jgi:hypothetical protein
VIIATNFANIRTGDSTLYPIVASGAFGQEFRIVGISSRGTGWYQIQLPSGALAWISPTVVTVAGDLRGIPFVVPPPLPPTLTPTTTLTPTVTPTATATGTSIPVNLIAGLTTLNPNPPVCNEQFIMEIQIQNTGTAASAPTTVSLVDSRAADNSVQATTFANVPAIDPGVTVNVAIPLTVTTWYNEIHRLTITVDPSNTVVESNETDNTRIGEYTLQQGACP